MTVREIQSGIGRFSPPEGEQERPTTNARLKIDRLANAAYLYLRSGVKRGEFDVQFVDEKHGTVSDFDSQGRLLGIEFIDLDQPDITALPQDDVVPIHDELIVMFKEKGIDPITEPSIDLSE